MCAVPSKCCGVELRVLCIFVCVCESVRRAICVCRVPLCDRETREGDQGVERVYARHERSRQQLLPRAVEVGDVRRPTVSLQLYLNVN